MYQYAIVRQASPAGGLGGGSPLGANLQEIVYLIKSIPHHAAASSEGAKSSRANSHWRSAASCCCRFRGLLTRKRTNCGRQSCRRASVQLPRTSRRSVCTLSPANTQLLAC